jgi:hypothetical protein
MYYLYTSDGNQGGPSLKDLLQVPDRPITRSDPLQVSYGPITRSRAKKIKEAMQRLVQSTWDEASKSPTLKVGLKEGEPRAYLESYFLGTRVSRSYCSAALFMRGYFWEKWLYYG